MNVFVPGFDPPEDLTEYPQVGIGRSGWEKTAHLPNDTMTFVTSENIEDAGRAVSLGLMIVGREIGY
jgi:hypothetical protein